MGALHSQLAADVAAMQPGNFYMLLVVVAAAAAIGVFYFLRNSFRARLIEDMPTSKVRSAAQGYVELIGQALMMPGEPVLSALTGTKCCWWRYKIEKEEGDSKWRPIESKTSDSPFFLEDATGRCIVDPEGADIIPWEKNTWRGSSKYPRTKSIAPGIAVAGALLGNGNYRYTEELIFSGNPLYAVGHFRSLDELDHRESRSEIMREILREWKRDKTALLTRFDKNDDGRIDMQEWETARKEAKILAHSEHQKMQENLVPHILSKPKNRGQPFILATKEEGRLAKGLRLWSYAALVPGITGFSSFIFMLVSRFAS